MLPMKLATTTTAKQKNIEHLLLRNLRGSQSHLCHLPFEPPACSYLILYSYILIVIENIFFGSAGWLGITGKSLFEFLAFFYDFL